jgi:hypothetical protein
MNKLLIRHFTAVDKELHCVPMLTAFAALKHGSRSWYSPRHCGPAVTLAIFSVAIAFSQPPTFSAQQHKFFRHVLRTIGSPDYGTDYIASFEKAFAGQYALNSQDAAAVHAVAQNFRSVVLSTRQSEVPILHNSALLTPSDGAAINSLLAKQEQAVDTLAAQLLNSLSPAAAQRLLAASNVVFAVGKKGN